MEPLGGIFAFCRNFRVLPNAKIPPSGSIFALPLAGHFQRSAEMKPLGGIFASWHPQKFRLAAPFLHSLLPGIYKGVRK